jgi:hypothetical protein
MKLIKSNLALNPSLRTDIQDPNPVSYYIIIISYTFKENPPLISNTGVFIYVLSLKDSKKIRH